MNRGFMQIAAVGLCLSTAVPGPGSRACLSGRQVPGQDGAYLSRDAGHETRDLTYGEQALALATFASGGTRPRRRARIIAQTPAAENVLSDKDRLILAWEELRNYRHEIGSKAFGLNYVLDDLAERYQGIRGNVHFTASQTALGNLIGTITNYRKLDEKIEAAESHDIVSLGEQLREQRATLQALFEEVATELGHFSFQIPFLETELESIRQLPDLFFGSKRKKSLVDLYGIAEERVIGMGGKICEGVSLQIEAKTELFLVQADAPALDEVLTILLDNARHIFEEKARKREIEGKKKRKGFVRIYFSYDNENVYLHITDDAGGINPLVLPFIFDQGFTTRKKAGGTGRGLYLARLFARDHGGDLTVVTQIRTGTTFTLRLPRADHAKKAPPPQQKRLTREAA